MSLALRQAGLGLGFSLSAPEGMASGAAASFDASFDVALGEDAIDEKNDGFAVLTFELLCLTESLIEAKVADGGSRWGVTFFSPQEKSVYGDMESRS